MVFISPSAIIGANVEASRHVVRQRIMYLWGRVAVTAMTVIVGIMVMDIP